MAGVLVKDEAKDALVQCEDNDNDRPLTPFHNRRKDLKMAFGEAPLGNA
jgi:hypothetical protein